MCGIAGIHSQKYDTMKLVDGMCQALRHRGPNASGQWQNLSSKIALGHTRLAIQDLSDQGSQPMCSQCKRYVIVFNGEIYNHLKLRSMLSVHSWRGFSDTETLLAAISKWGINETLQKLTGMFAFALWDQKLNKLYLCRDRAGEKPVYWGILDDSFVFASELKALKTISNLKFEIDRNALALYLKYAYVPAPCSIYKNIYKLEPGSLLTADLKNDQVAFDNVKLEKYWVQSKIAIEGDQQPINFDEKTAIKKVESTLLESVEGQLLSDVPVGAFLSGGIDSSLVVSLMQSISNKPVKTFTIGYNESEYNEANYSKAVAKHLKTDHREKLVTVDDVISLIPKVPNIFCEPFADSSQLPTLLVSEFARQSVTVALTGDGADELFGGYNRHTGISGVLKPLMALPFPLRMALSHSIKLFSPSSLDKMYKYARKPLGGALSYSLAGEKLHKLSNVITAKDYTDYYFRTCQINQNIDSLLEFDYQAHEENDDILFENFRQVENYVMSMDFDTYLNGDILTKVDRSSMAYSLETRAPFLDHQLIDLARRIPIQYKVRRGHGKIILRKILSKYVPNDLIDRPKMGFGVPIGSWLRGPLRPWAEELLDENLIRKDGYLCVDKVKQMWLQHISGKRNWQHQLWTILMFQAWLMNNREI